ncbi:MAG: lamin tail domain-containing protein, partial [Anaerolineae bacterium]|nr:lamin tail domain-containing protein [Anaerolineae bacterium]
PGDLVFSEMMINPDLVYDEVGEWVELYNTASYAIDVGGYSFHDDDYDHYALVGPLIVEGGDYLVLCASTNRAENGGVDCDGWFHRDYQGDGLALANREDEVVLSRPDGVEIDWLHYDEDWFQMGVAIGIDPSFMTSGANDDREHWCDQVSVMESGEFGTPGRENDRCQ